MPYLSTDSDNNIKRLKNPDEVLVEVIGEITKSEVVLSDWKNKIVKYYELYQLVQRKKHYSGLSNIFVPETLRAVETIVAKLYQMIFAQTDWFEYKGRDNNGDEGPAMALTQLTFYQMEENGFKSRVMDCLRQMVIGGLCVRKILWDYQEVERTKPKYNKDNIGEEKVVETIRDHWTFEPVDLLSFHISDINVPYNDVQKASWIGEQYLVDKNWVKERCRRGWFSKEMKDKLEEAESASSSTAETLKDNRLSSSGFNKSDKKGKIEIIERWGLCPVEWVLTDEQMKDENYEAGDLIESVIVVANRVAILKLEKNPFRHKQKPYVVCPYIPKEFELPGIGAVQVGESLQEEINDTRNQTMDNKTLILATMWLKSRASGIKNVDLTIRPNGVIPTNDINGLVPLRPPVITGVGTNMESIAKEDLRQSVGAASNLQGIAQPGVGTATEANTINRESIGRLLLTAQLFVELVIKPTLIFAEYNNYQFYDHVKVIKIIGPIGVKYRKIAPEEILDGLKDVSIKVSLDITENPAVMRQQFMNFLNIMLQLPPQVIPMHYKALDKAYGMFFNGHKLEEIYPNPNVDPASLLSPEEERDMVLAEQPVEAQRGQDHQAYIQYHESEFGQMAFALNQTQFEIYKKLIMSHYQLMQMEMQEAMMQFQAQQMMSQGQGQKDGNIVDRGRTQNASPFTQTKAPSTSSLGKEIGG